MDDGSSCISSGFLLHTNGFTFSDVYLLIKILHYNFGLYCTVQKVTKPVIYIRGSSATQT